VYLTLLHAGCCRSSVQVSNESNYLNFLGLEYTEWRHTARLGLLIFIILINDLRTWLYMHKFIDYTTLSEIVQNGSESDVQRALDTVLE